MTAAEIAGIVTPVVIAAGFYFAWRQWVSGRNARMAQIMLSITERWDSLELEQARQKVNTSTHLRQDIDQADATNSPDLYQLVKIANFFDAMGLMVMEGFLGCRIAYTLFGRAEEHYYRVYRPILEEPKYRDYFKYFIQLHACFIKEEAKLSKIRPHPPQ